MTNALRVLTMRALAVAVVAAAYAADHSSLPLLPFSSFTSALLFAHIPGVLCVLSFFSVPPLAPLLLRPPFDDSKSMIHFPNLAPARSTAKRARRQNELRTSGRAHRAALSFGASSGLGRENRVIVFVSGVATRSISFASNHRKRSVANALLQCLFKRFDFSSQPLIAAPQIGQSMHQCVFGGVLTAERQTATNQKAQCRLTNLNLLETQNTQHYQRQA